jgi:hypothetical protein
MSIGRWRRGRGDFAQQRDHQRSEGEANPNGQERIGKGLDACFAVSERPELLEGGRLTMEQVTSIGRGEFRSDLMQHPLHGGIG